MKKTLLRPLSLFCRVRGAMPPLSGVPAYTAISSHSLAALPAKMSAFSSHMRQNAYYRIWRNLKWTEDLLPCYCYTIKTKSKTIRLQVWQPALCRQRSGQEWVASSPLPDTRTVNLAQVQCACHSGKSTVIARIKSINWNWAADVKFSRKFWFLVSISSEGQMPVLT